MPLVQGRKRRTEAANEESPEPPPERQTQRRRTSTGSFGEDYDGNEAEETTSGGDVEEMVKKLIRLAMACEYQRRPIRRADIVEKILGTNSRQFKTVFNTAQVRLRAIFGWEMVELPAKEKITLHQKRAAQKAASQSKTSTSWMLTSILPSSLRNPAIVQPPSGPTLAEESKYVAVSSIIVSLISLSGGDIAESKMERYLKKLGMEDNAPIQDFEKTEKLLKRMEKDGYIVRIRESTGGGEEDISWIVGPRGKVEVGANGTRGLVTMVYGDLSEEAEDDLERKISRSLGYDQQAEVVEHPPAAEAQQRQRKQPSGRRVRGDDQDPCDDDDGDDDNDESGNDE